MNEQNVVTQFYNTINEEERLQDKHGQVEFRTTMKYIGRRMRTTLLP